MKKDEKKLTEEQIKSIRIDKQKLVNSNEIVKK